MQIYNQYIHLELFEIIIVSIKYKYTFHSQVISIIRGLLPTLINILEICTYAWNKDRVDIIIDGFWGCKMC